MSEEKQTKQPKLFELNAKLECSVVIRAYSEEEALEHVRLWEESWVNGGGRLLGVIDVDVFDVRDGSSDDADEDLTKDYSEDE
ncbi:MAG: hypothetical protein WCS73_11705 [Lentisphaeria bacterium]|jgi:hypothetical protein